MKANELRIGNWIFDAGDEQKNFQIEQICKDSDGFSGYYVVYRNGSFKSSIDSDLIEPIVLIPEILEKCGFEKSPANNSYYKSYPEMKSEIHFEYFRGGLVCNLYQSVGSFIPSDIKYLHQLQNLIHALTGEELEVKL